jgi:predicted metalloendopeptidase
MNKIAKSEINSLLYDGFSSIKKITDKLDEKTAKAIKQAAAKIAMAVKTLQKKADIITNPIDSDSLETAKLSAVGGALKKVMPWAKFTNFSLSATPVETGVGGLGSNKVNFDVEVPANAPSDEDIKLAIDNAVRNGTKYSLVPGKVRLVRR